jgi:hypothetical protein
VVSGCLGFGVDFMIGAVLNRARRMDQGVLGTEDSGRKLWAGSVVTGFFFVILGFGVGFMIAAMGNGAGWMDQRVQDIHF